MRKGGRSEKKRPLAKISEMKEDNEETVEEDTKKPMKRSRKGRVPLMLTSNPTVPSIPSVETAVDCRFVDELDWNLFSESFNLCQPQANDLHPLQPRNWLNSTIINLFLDYSTRKYYSTQNSYAIETYWLDETFKGIKKAKTPIEFVEKLYEKYKKFQPKYFSNFCLEENKILFFPINFNNLHWSLMVVRNLNNLKVK
jgi:hypothetical protein